MVELMRLSHHDRIDLIDIKKQRDPLLHFQIFSTGKCLYESQPGVFLEKHADALGYYWDTAPFRKDQEEVLKKKINQLNNA